MEIKISTQQVLNVLKVIAWIIFIGLCIDAGGLIVNSFITLFVNSQAVNNFWIDSEYFSELLSFDRGNFIVIAILMIIVAVLKSIMFYLIVKLFSENQLNFMQPFSVPLRQFIKNLVYLSLAIGIFSFYGMRYTDWLSSKGMSEANLQELNIAGADVWLFMAVILFVIVQIVKRGIEIQTENELTV